MSIESVQRIDSHQNIIEIAEVEDNGEYHSGLGNNHNCTTSPSNRIEITINNIPAAISRVLGDSTFAR